MAWALTPFTLSENSGPDFHSCHYISLISCINNTYIIKYNTQFSKKEAPDSKKEAPDVGHWEVPHTSIPKHKYTIWNNISHHRKTYHYEEAHFAILNFRF